jgi:hypothetical protein
MKNGHENRTAKCVFFYLMTALVGMLPALGGCGGPAVVPKTFSTYKDPNGFFSIQYPDQWSANTGSSSEAKKGWADYTSGSSRINVAVCPVAEFITAIAQTGINPIVDLDFAPAKAASKVHWIEKPGEDSGIKEQRALPVTTNAGRGSQSEYTTTDPGSPMHGYRATVVIGKNRVQIICECPEAEWKVLKPAFDQVIASVGP